MTALALLETALAPWRLFWGSRRVAHLLRATAEVLDPDPCAERAEQEYLARLDEEAAA